MEKRPPITPRLQSIAELISPCRCVADIGTDHGYLPVWLCLNNRCETAIAADVNPGPLAKAKETVLRFGLEDRVSLRLGSGGEPLAPGEANAIVLAGMGGLLIGELLQAAPEVFGTAAQILLQPMSSIPELREKLYAMGYSVRQEILVPEEEKLYHILSVEKTPETASFSAADFVLGRTLCQTRPAHFDRYLALQQKRFSEKLAGLKQGKNPNGTAIAETEALLRQIEALMQEVL